MKIGAIIEARMSSSRLPGKVLLPVAKKPMLLHLVERLRKIKKIDKIIIATTTNQKDLEIVKFCKKFKIDFFRGSENDVMGRVISAAKKFKIDLITELTGDCPIIDHKLIDQCIELFLNNKVDYVTNCKVRSYPDGMDTQVYKLNTLIKSSKMTKNKLDREHVTLHIRNHPNIFKTINLMPDSSLYWPDLGLTLDEHNDYVLLKKIIEHFYRKKKKFFSCEEVINFLKSNKKIRNINKIVKRKNNA
jgi:spore coat polysaccharide biosynthesis protein SpsF